MDALYGKSLIAGNRSNRTGETFAAISPLDDKPLPGDFLTAAPDEVDAAMKAARAAFPAFRDSTGETRAAFLEKIAANLDAVASDLIGRAHLETGLPETRLRSELARTTGHLRMFGAIARSGSWMDPRHEPADPERKPLPRPDLRRTFQPLGPVVVFGSSNFPLAYSVAGGDTASALATGNPVVVKAHEAHPGTSEIVAEAICSAARAAGLPGGVFSMLQGPGQALAVPLVVHPETRAVGFTGSTHVGRILIDAAARRPDPIPVFAEMGSLNPIVVLPSAFGRAGHFAELLVPSITNDSGQFCTKPGVVILPDDGSAEPFLRLLAAGLENVTPAPMLHRGIHRNFIKATASLAANPNVRVLASKAATSGPLDGPPHLFVTDHASFRSDESLRQEFFGPLSILVLTPPENIEAVLRSLSGQLTASVFCAPGDPAARELLPLLGEIAGRVVFNGVPTGVEVNSAIQHGGPWPACSDPRFSAVGPDALRRFIRPVAWQNLPDDLF